jgi:hypothetical protein
MESEPQPTFQDRENARRRQEIADHFRTQFEEARALVESVLGPGFIPVGRHYLVDHDEEERARSTGGPGTPAATVISAEKGGVRRHVLVIGDRLRECSGYEDGFGAMLTEPDPQRTFLHKGEQVHVHKHSLYWAGYEKDYAPRTAEQLAAAREKREEKAEEKEQKEIEYLANASLFPEWIKEQAAEQKEKKKGRKR